jgi:anti-sigma B factor antagonist
MALRLVLDGAAAQAVDEAVPAFEVEFRVGLVHEGSGVRVRPAGEVDIATIGCLQERMNDAMAAGRDRVVLDLRATTFFDSTGLRLVLETDDWARDRGTEFVIIAGPPIVQQAFEAAGLRGRLPFADGSVAPA